MYYRYWMHKENPHNSYAHYGVRSQRYKLIYWYNESLGQPGAKDEPEPPEWELFDLQTDPHELRNVYGDAEYSGVVREMTEELNRLQTYYGDTPRH